jgi:multidrug efflux pump
MEEVGGALVAIALVLSAVFIPSAFLTGITGQFFRQFAVTIATATAISLLVSLTLSPALCALLFKPHEAEPEKKSIFTRPIRAFFNGFNRAFEWVSSRYGALTARLVRVSVLMLVVYGGLIALTAYQFVKAPTGFIPAQDQGYLINIIQLPPGASLARTDEVARKVTQIVLKTPGIAHAVPIVGLDGATFTTAPNAAVVFTPLDDFAERAKKGQSAQNLIVALNTQFAAIQEAFVVSVSPPPVRGIGTTGGFKLEVQDTHGGEPAQLEAVAMSIVGAAAQTPGLANVFTTFNTRTPKVYADIDRVRAEMLGVNTDDVFQTLEVYLGSQYVNDFNFLGRTYRVMAQADGDFRQDLHAIGQLKTRNAAGEMVPLSSVASFRNITGPYRVEHFNLYPSAAIQGGTLPGYSSGYGLAAMERLAQENLPEGYSYSWTEIAFQERLAGNTAIYIFLASVVFVFLLLAAQYESWTLPLAVILIVPMCLLAAVSGLLARSMDVNILAQIGFVVLIGLAAKNAILIVEFARQNEEHGEDRFQAATEAARVRLRPILMTSFAFILGVLPLVIATGAGAEMRQSLGTGVFFGMLGVTFFGLIFTPVFYVVVRRFAKKPRAHGSPSRVPAE